MALADYLTSSRVPPAKASKRWEQLKVQHDAAYALIPGISFLMSQQIAVELGALQGNVRGLHAHVTQWKNLLCPQREALTPSSTLLIPQRVTDGLESLDNKLNQFTGEPTERLAMMAARSLTVKTGSDVFMLDSDTIQQLRSLTSERICGSLSIESSWIGGLPFDAVLTEKLKTVFLLGQEKPYAKRRIKEPVRSNIKSLRKVTAAGLEAVNTFYSTYEGGLDVSILARIESIGLRLLNLQKALDVWTGSVKVCLNLATGQQPLGPVKGKKPLTDLSRPS